MNFTFTLTHNDVTVQIESNNMLDFSQLNTFLNSLTTKAVKEVQKTAPEKRGRGRPRKNP